MCLGCVSAFGLSVVANFQETNVFRVHMIGAMMAFGFGVMYAWSQTYMSFKMVPLVNSKRMAYCRLFLSILMTCTFTTSSICGPMAFRRFNGKDPTNWRRKYIFSSHYSVSPINYSTCTLILINCALLAYVNCNSLWKQTTNFSLFFLCACANAAWDGGWNLHIISTCCEWVSAMSLDFFILSFVREMHLISLTSPRVNFSIRSIILPNQDTSWSVAPGIDTEVSIRSNNGIRQVTRIDPSNSDANFTSVSELSDSYNQSIIGWVVTNSFFI